MAFCLVVSSSSLLSSACLNNWFLLEPGFASVPQFSLELSKVFSSLNSFPLQVDGIQELTGVFPLVKGFLKWDRGVSFWKLILLFTQPALLL